MTDIKPKKKQGPKPGKVIRADPELQKLIEEVRKPRETILSALRRLAGLPPKKGDGSAPETLYVLRESGVFARTLAEARGLAVMMAVKDKKGKTQIEKPIKVRVIE